MYAEYIRLREKLIKMIRPQRFELPGYDPKGDEKTTFYTLLALSFLLSLTFVFRYGMYRERLYYTNYETGEKFLWENAVMTDFDQVLSWSLAGFLLTAVVCLFYIGVRWNYLHKESKSIYLMRRLPQKGELFRRCAAVPLYRSAVCLVCAFAVLLLCFVIYIGATPAQCLAPDQWAKIWR